MASLKPSTLPSRYLFNHIPKTGGTTFLHICRQNLRQSEISPHLTEDEVRLGSTEPWEAYRLIAGHFSVPTQGRFSPERYTMTFIRDPIRTIVSTYSFWRGIQGGSGPVRKARELSFADFVGFFRDSPAVINNRFTHHFAGIPKDCPDEPMEESALLAAAKQNLAAYDFIGLCDEYQRSIEFLCETLEWHMPNPLPSDNRSGSEDVLAGMDPWAKKILSERTRLDSQLYAYGRALIKERQAAKGDSRGANTKSCANAGMIPTLSCVPMPSILKRKATIQNVSACLSWDSSRILKIGITLRTDLLDEPLVLGVAIYGSAGYYIWGVNTEMENIVLNIRTTELHHADWLLEFNAPPGLYQVTTALHRQRRLGFHEHWVDRAAIFKIPYSDGDRGEASFFRLLSFTCAQA